MKDRVDKSRGMVVVTLIAELCLKSKEQMVAE
jgi:hypothetical protein